tara:strand:- start:108 stop:449 length:342 start_codon:yes stop_codon:yes gene_type:complete
MAAVPVPTLAMLGLAGLTLYHMSRPQSASDLASSVHANSALTTGQHAMGAGTSTCSRNCTPMHQIWLDTPVNTVLKSSPQNLTLEQVYKQQRAQYAKEASESPGVNLVAHAVA